MAEKPGNRRMLIGLAIFLCLLGANVFTRLGRTPPTVAVSKPEGSDPLTKPPQAGVTPTPTLPNQLVPANPSALSNPANPSQTDLSALLNAPLSKTRPIDAIRELRDRLKLLPPILHVGSPSMLIGEPRNPFQWVLPEPLVVSLASETSLATGPPGLPKPEERKISYAGSFVMFGKRIALLRHGDEMHLVPENESLPESSLLLTSVSTNSALLENAGGLKVFVEGELRDSTGFLKAMAALQGERELHGYPIRALPVGSSSSFVERASSSPTL